MSRMCDRDLESVVAGASKAPVIVKVPTRPAVRPLAPSGGLASAMAAPVPAAVSAPVPAASAPSAPASGGCAAGKCSI